MLSGAYNNAFLPLHRADSLETISDILAHKRKQTLHLVCLFQSAKPGIVSLHLRRAQGLSNNLFVPLEFMNAKLSRRNGLTKALLVLFKLGDLLLIHGLGVK